MIVHIRHQDIDKEKWDRCIDHSSNGMIYASSWYLDEVCPGWHALISGDYEYIMPLAVNRRLGISYIYAPYYAQQLGVIGDHPDREIVKEFINKIPSFIKLADIKMNENNLLSAEDSRFKTKNNYLLSMETSYEETSKKYNRNCRRNIKKAHDRGLKPGNSIDAGEFARFIWSSLEDQMEDLDKKAIRVLERLTRKFVSRGQGEIATVVDEKGKLCAAGSFLFQKDRLIFSVCASSPEGKNNQAMYMLVDEEIKKYAGKYRVFDFSGSDIKGIAYFNSTFGAEAVQYYVLHLNRLNWLQRILSGKFH